MTTEILKAEDFGLDLTTAQKIESSFLPKVIERNALVQVYENLLTMEINPETCAEAKKCRLKLVKVRTGIADIHKAEKAMALAYGKFCDAKKNAETLPVEQMEERLKDIELYYERIEEARIAQLKKDREALIAPYIEEHIEGLHMMGEENFQRFLAGEKLAFEQRKIEKAAAEQKAKDEAEELEKLRKENELLKAKVIPIVEVKQGMTESEIILATIENLTLSFAVDNELTKDITAKFNGFKTWAKAQITNK